MAKKKLLEFQANISDVVQTSPLFSTCRIRVLYTGRNPNLSNITLDAVNKALPSLIGIPIVGEYSEENKDFKGHGGKIDLDSFRYIHTTKPYGFVPETATYEWEEVTDKNGNKRDYLVVDGCKLWTGRYEEAFSIIEKSKGQSMEIEVLDGRWDDVEEEYIIDNFMFSALCVLGDDVAPAFADANISTAYSLDKDTFKQEFAEMLLEFKLSQESDKEVDKMFKELLKKYSITEEDLKAKGIQYEGLSEDDLELKIKEAFADDKTTDDKATDTTDDKTTDDDKDVRETPNTVVDEKQTIVDEVENKDDEAKDSGESNKESLVKVADDDYKPVDQTEEVKDNGEPSGKDEVQESQNEKQSYEALKVDYDKLVVEVEELREFKQSKLKETHEADATELFTRFELDEDDIKGIDVHKFSLEELEDKCYAILGRKVASKKNFSKDEEKGIRLPISNKEDKEDKTSSRYGDLFEKYKK